MKSMLSGIPASSFWRGDRPTLSRVVRRPPRSPSAAADDPSSAEVDLRDLNASLEALAAVFPDVRVEVFREMLTNFSDVSRLQLVAESLLKHKAKWVRGRWHVPLPQQDQQASTQRGSVSLPSRERFRSSGYKSAVKEALYQEFKGLSHSTIKAVLAEHNYSYADTRLALLSLSSTSWRYSLASMLLRRKTPTADYHPFLAWRPSRSGNLEPALIRPSNAELTRELEDCVLAPLLRVRAAKQLRQDFEVAQRLNESEAERQGSLFDCECCFSSNTFENITTCGLGHYMCFSCVRNTLTEAVYGQGWAKGVDVERCTLRCIALSTGNGTACHGSIPQTSLQKICCDEQIARDSYQKFEERLARDCLTRSHVQLLRCPFCAYAEEENACLSVVQEDQQGSHFAFTFLAILVTLTTLLRLTTSFFESLFTFVAVLVAVALYNHSVWVQGFKGPLPDAAGHAHHGRKFMCRNTHCSRTSCLRCSAPWTDIHVCFQSSRQALRTYLESAITEAIKRTCPQCNLAFVKSSGCNKLVCVCGYTMCYVCRGDIGTEGYMHFCQHFRPDPGQSCKECERCDLYRVEDEDIVIKRAKESALEEWKVRQQTSGASPEGGQGWNPEHEAEGVIGDSAASWRKGWLQT